MAFKIRPLSESDSEDGAALLASIWRYDHLASKKVCKLQGLYDFYSCLGRSDVRLGAFEDGKLVGVLLANTGKFRSDKDLRIAEKMGLDTVFEPGGFLLNTYNKDYAQRSGALFEDVTEPELALLMVRYKGLGIGSALIKAYEEILKKRGIKSYVVLSDTKCDYDFYPHAGYEKIGEDLGEDPIEDKELSLFLYKKEL